MSQLAGVVGNLVQVSFSLLFYLQVYLEDEIDPGLFWGLAIFSPCAFAFAIDKVMKRKLILDKVLFSCLFCAVSVSNQLFSYLF